MEPKAVPVICLVISGKVSDVTTQESATMFVFDGWVVPIVTGIVHGRDHTMQGKLFEVFNHWRLSEGGLGAGLALVVTGSAGCGSGCGL